jgi:hypothetical protein
MKSSQLHRKSGVHLISQRGNFVTVTSKKEYAFRIKRACHRLATLAESNAMCFYYYSGVSSCKHDGLNARLALWPVVNPLIVAHWSVLKLVTRVHKTQCSKRHDLLCLLLSLTCNKRTKWTQNAKENFAPSKVLNEFWLNLVLRVYTCAVTFCLLGCSSIVKTEATILPKRR